MLNIRLIARVAGIGIVLLLYSFTSPGEARAQAARQKMCSWVDSIAVISRSLPSRQPSNSIQARMREMMRENLVENAIEGLSRKSLKHVNERCSGLGVDQGAQGWTPLLMAALKLSDLHLPVFRHLLSNGADVGVRVPSQEETLDLPRSAAGRGASRGRKRTRAADKAKVEAAAMLLLLSGDKPDPRYDGATALHIAADKPGTVAVARLLIDNGADVAATTVAGATALHFAAAGGDTATLELLLDREADVEARNDRGYTALHCAAAEGSNSRAVMVLIDLAGADTEALTDAGETTYDLIMRNPKLKESEAAEALRLNR